MRPSIDGGDGVRMGCSLEDMAILQGIGIEVIGSSVAGESVENFLRLGWMIAIQLTEWAVFQAYFCLTAMDNVDVPYPRTHPNISQARSVCREDGISSDLTDQCDHWFVRWRLKHAK